MLVMSWILNVCMNCKTGGYLSDISGAFDRVYKEYLLGKLMSAGVAPVFLDFLSSYLDPRIGQVTIAGALSEAFVMADTIFQGTVLGPCLWNRFW